MRRNQRFIIVVLLLLGFVVGGVVLLRQRTSTNATQNAQESPKAEGEQVKSTGNLTVGVEKKLSSQDEYNKYLAGLSKSLLGSLHVPESFDWQGNDYLPISFFTSPGVTYKSTKLVGSELEVTLIAAPKGCLYTQVQHLQYVLVAVPKGFNGTLADTAKSVLLENTNSCPF